jgi:ABC-2 type transport system ATP-binding protein
MERVEGYDQHLNQDSNQNQDWLRFTQVKKSFSEGFLSRPKPVIQEASFSLKKGRSTGFVGANGSGKTTLLKLALGFIFPTSGLIEYPSSDNDFTSFKRNLGYLPERPYYYDFLTAYEFLKMHWSLGGAKVQEKRSFIEEASRVLKQVKLDKEGPHRLRTFSKGMLQRMGIAQALLHNPQYLILDEPMSGLDPDGRYEMRSLLKQEKQKGRTLFFSSHLIEDVEALCDDVVIITKGIISFSGSIQKLKEESHHESLVDIINELKVGGRS